MENKLIIYNVWRIKKKQQFQPQFQISTQVSHAIRHQELCLIAPVNTNLTPSTFPFQEVMSIPIDAELGRVRVPTRWINCITINTVKPFFAKEICAMTLNTWVSAFAHKIEISNIRIKEFFETIHNDNAFIECLYSIFS